MNQGLINGQEKVQAAPANSCESLFACWASWKDKRVVGVKRWKELHRLVYTRKSSATT